MAARLTSVESLKNYMRLAGDENNGALAQIIDAVSDGIEQYCRRPFARAECSEIHDGVGGDRLFLRRRPIIDVAAVWDDPERRFASGAALDAAHYLFDPATGILTRVHGCFAHGLRTVRVDYEGGYDVPPPSVAQAANVLAAHYFLRGRQGGDGVATESIGSYAVSFDSADWPGTAKALLAEFREWSV